MHFAKIKDKVRNSQVLLSSVARGGGGGGSSPPTGLWSMQNRTFLVLLMPIFCEKLKIAPPIGKQPPSNVWTSEFGRKISFNFSEDLFLFLFLETTWFWVEKTFEFRIPAEKSVSISVKTFFFFFWRPPDFGRKKPLNFGAFRKISSQFSDKPRETDSRAMKIRVKDVCTFLTLSK